ncbi:MAG: methylated-DNA--[protein]-cysteine S-methyltransferase [Bauldia sp.]|nr:methylated-DNA--[protein]-cysteine S-methyltransferase [Bauldia sp.]
MTEVGLALFDTPIGPCCVAWGPAGIVALQLPEPSPESTRSRLRRVHPGAIEMAPPEPVASAVAAICDLLRGEPRDLGGIVLDMRGIGDFEASVYAVARTIPPGRTMTYGEVATRLGEPGAARAVGRALGRNPFAIIVPCHRVVAAGGRIGGFSASGGVGTKRRILAIEGAEPDAPTLPGFL